MGLRRVTLAPHLPSFDNPFGLMYKNDSGLFTSVQRGCAEQILDGTDVEISQYRGVCVARSPRCPYGESRPGQAQIFSGISAER